MTDGTIGLIAGAATSLVIKGIDLLIAYDRGRRGEGVKERERLSQDIWKLVGELRNDYDRLDGELRAEREARRHAEEEVLALTHQVAALQEQIHHQETETEHFRALAGERQSKVNELARQVAALQAEVAGLSVQAGMKNG